jgi:hypothetical protein
MQNWQKYLKGDPQSWLRDPENPSIRYWTLIDILDRSESDPEVQETRSTIAQQALVKELFALQHPEGYWGDETKPHNAQGAVAALNGLAVLPAGMRSEQSERVLKRLADTLLDAPYDFEGEHKRWFTFGVPRGWDLLSALKALAANGYAHDARFMALLKRVIDRQNGQGQWLCGSVSRTWPVEKRNQPSKWVTLDALRLLKYLE